MGFDTRNASLAQTTRRNWQDGVVPDATGEAAAAAEEAPPGEVPPGEAPTGVGDNATEPFAELDAENATNATAPPQMRWNDGVAMKINSPEAVNWTDGTLRAATWGSAQDVVDIIYGGPGAEKNYDLDGDTSVPGPEHMQGWPLQGATKNESWTPQPGRPATSLLQVGQSEALRKAMERTAML